MTLRAVRNNNPGNIAYNPRKPIDWLGREPHKPGEHFVHFKSPHYGMRALARVLITKYKEGKANTLKDLIQSYESDPNVNNIPAYITSMVRSTGISENTPLNLVKNTDQLKSIMKGIVYHESGVHNLFPNTYDSAIKSALKGSAPTKPLTSQQKTGQKAQPTPYNNSQANVFIDMSVIRNIEGQMSQTNEAKYCFVNQCFSFNLQELLLQYSALANHYNAEYR